MAKAQGGLGDGLRGKIDGLSFYTMKGVEGTIVRRSSGHTKEKKNSDPKLRNFKLAGEDFAGRARMSKFLMGALAHQKPMADYNIAGPLIALMKPVQELDSEGDYGARNVKLTAYPHVLKGFSLNNSHPLDTVIRFPVTGSINRETLSAKVQFPELVPGINFAPSAKQPYYAFRISLAVVPDIIFNKGLFTATHPGYPISCAKSVDSDWFSLQEGSKALEMEVGTVFTPPDTNFTLILTAGILYGELKALEHIGQVRHAGSSKVLEVG